MTDLQYYHEDSMLNVHLASRENVGVSHDESRLLCTDERIPFSRTFTDMTDAEDIVSCVGCRRFLRMRDEP